VTNVVVPSIHPASQEAIERFCDACWLEDGLAQNSLSAYRRDLLLLAQWLQKDSGIDLYGVAEKNLTAYIAHRRADKATTANRRLTVFKRFYRHALRMNLVKSDPCIGLRAAKQALRFPKTLSEDQVTALLNAPDVETALGLRDRTMLELMYASGLRVSEIVA
jgi:integrase/recombinase XerD